MCCTEDLKKRILEGVIIVRRIAWVEQVPPLQKILGHGKNQLAHLEPEPASASTDASNFIYASAENILYMSCKHYSS